MANTNGYRLGQLIVLQQNQIAEVKKGVAYIKLTLSFAFVTTWILYFIFAFAFYVADLWGISTWLTQNTSELVAFALFLLMALLMAQSLSMIKHAFYHHKAAFQYGIAALLVICSLGVFMELFNSSSQQQTIAHHTAEQSKSFEAVNNSVVNVPTANHAGRVASLSGELATAQSYLEGCKKTCNHYRAKVASLEQQIESLKASDAATLEASKIIGDQTLKTKAELSEKLKEEAHKPVFKFIRDVLGVTISTAVVIISCIVAAGFEFSHALLSRMLGEKLTHLTALQDQLVKLKTDYLGETGHEYGSATPASAEPENAAPSQFKYQQAAPFVSGFSSFKQPMLKNLVPQPTPTPLPTHQTQQGTPEEQLPLPELSDSETVSRPLANGSETGTVQNPAKTVSAPLANGSEGLYGAWVNAVKAGECLPSVKPTWTWIQKRISNKETGSRTHDRTRISNMQKAFFSRAMKEGLMIENPNYSNGGKKYLWIA